MSQFMTGTKTHIFEWESVQQNVRFVINVEDWRLIAAQVQRDEAGGAFAHATRYELKELEQFFERNSAYYTQPLEFGLIACEGEELPDWVADC